MCGESGFVDFLFAPLDGTPMFTLLVEHLAVTPELCKDARRFQVASLMSVVSSRFEDMLEGFQEGRAPVAEERHVVILGWSPVAPILVDEFCKAAELRGGTVTTILTPFPEPEVEGTLQSAVKHFRSSIITVRRGDRVRGNDLKEVAPALPSELWCSRDWTCDGISGAVLRGTL